MPSNRLNTLERTVARLTEAVGINSGPATDSGTIHPSPGPNISAPPSQEPPILVIRRAVSETEPAFETDAAPKTIVDKGYVNPLEAGQLLDSFTNQYGRWVTLREGDQDGPGLDFWSSPLLLCACCLIAIRHWPGPSARRTADVLFSEAKSLLSQQLLQSPQPLAFFQAVLVLSLWSTTVGQKPLSIDSWMITGFAIQHGLASRVLVDSQRNVLAKQFNPGGSLGEMLLWTRLCLSHLHACISIRRNAIISKTDIEHLTKSLPTQQLSNFELRMLGELNLYWTIYENLQVSTFGLTQAQVALQSWKKYWSYLFDQPRSQFIEMGYRFAELLIYEQSLNHKSSAVRESLVSEMIRSCSAILRLALGTTDERTRYLTDHIYHMITFAAVTLCRLLCKYEKQLIVTQDVDELDAAIPRIAQWLLSLGTNTHIGYVMGKVVDNMGRKLRPSAMLSAQTQFGSEQAVSDHQMVPELLETGIDSWALDWDTSIPDWQSIVSDATPSVTQSQVTRNEQL